MKVNNRIYKRNVPLKNKVHKLNKRIKNSVSIKEYIKLETDCYRIKASYENLKIDFNMLVEANNKYFNGIQEVIKILKNDPEYEKIGSHEAKRKLIELVGVESL